MGGMPRHSGQFSRDSGTFWEFRRFADLAYLLVFWTPSPVWNLGMVSRASRGGHQVSENTCDDFGIVMPITTLLCVQFGLELGSITWFFIVDPKEGNLSLE